MHKAGEFLRMSNAAVHQEGGCICEAVSYTSGEEYLHVRYGCRMHCPAPPSPVLYAHEITFGARSEATIVMTLRDRYDPIKNYKVRLRGELAVRMAEIAQDRSRLSELQLFLEGYLAGKGEI
jgi:hypothetical protein